jgi:hypothetical protein
MIATVDQDGSLCRVRSSVGQEAVHHAPAVFEAELLALPGRAADATVFGDPRRHRFGAHVTAARQEGNVPRFKS